MLFKNRYVPEMAAMTRFGFILGALSKYARFSCDEAVWPFVRVESPVRGNPDASTGRAVFITLKAGLSI